MAKLAQIEPNKKPIKFEIREKRREPRVAVQTHKPVVIQVEQTKDAFRGKMVDISRGGIFVVTTSLPPVGTVCTVRILGSDSEDLLRAQGKIVRHASNTRGDTGFGMEFSTVHFCAAEIVELLKKKEG